MNIRKRSLQCVVMALAVTGGLGWRVLAAPQTSPAKPAQSARSGEVTAILVDVVVRDKAGQPVADLKPEEIQVIEDGVKQDVGSFTPIFKDGPNATVKSATTVLQAGALPGAASRPSGPADIQGTPGAAAAVAAANAPTEVLALLFDRLDGESRATAYRAALGYVDTETPDARAVAVFGIDLGLVPYQGFTRDIKQVKKAIEKFGNRAVSQFGSTATERRDMEERARAAGAAAAAQESQASAGGPGAAGSSMGAAQSDQMFADMQARSLQTFDALERDQRGYSTANALMAVVSSMRTLPGRKAVVFFSEGLSIPPNAQERFVAVVAAANRANVSIYSVDAKGLRTESTTKEARDEINAASQRMLSRNPAKDVTGEPMMAALERNENNLRLDPHSGLGLLAQQTGGLLVSNTNDFRRGLARVDSDMRNYYMVSYVPKNNEFDGRFREIAVKVTRPNVTVQHRKGYFAVRAPAGAPVLSYEAPALALLDRTPVPNAFPVRTGALRFPDEKRPGLTPLVVELPTSGITFKAAEDGYRSDVAIVVRIRNENGDLVDKMSQRYELTATAEQLPRAKSGEVIFYRQPDLPPGVYTAETVVRDALAETASVRFTTVEVRPTDPGHLRMSTLMLIRRVEKVPEAERISDSPLYMGDTLLYPNLGTPLAQGEKELGFYFTAYLPPSGPDASAAMTLVKNGQVVASVPLPLEKPDAQRRIRQLGRIPTEQLAAGNYELRVSVQQGNTHVSETAPFRVAGQ